MVKAEPLSARKARLRGMERWILGHKDEIRRALYADMGKSAPEADRSEIFPVLAEVRKASRNLKRWARPRRVRTSFTFLGTRAFVHYEPKGVCLIISPWNYPLLLSLGPVVSAIAAGNTFLLKPSEFTPHVSGLLKQMVRELFPENIGWVAEGDATVSQALLQLPFDHIFFTGSPAVGRIVMKAAAEHLSSVTLELGGKSPTIVDETASLEDAAKKIAWGKWLNAGQTCLAPDYLLVHKNVMNSFLGKLKDQAEKRFKDSEYTSIINRTHFNRLRAYIADAEKKGATEVVEGRLDEANCRMHPFIFTEVNDQMLLMQEEIFGPVLPVDRKSVV